MLHVRKFLIASFYAIVVDFVSVSRHQIWSCVVHVYGFRHTHHHVREKDKLIYTPCHCQGYLNVSNN